MDISHRILTLLFAGLAIIGLFASAAIDNGAVAVGEPFVTLNFNDEDPALAEAARNVTVRRVLSLAIDRVAAVNNILMGTGTPQYVPFTLSGDAGATFFVGRDNTCADFAFLGLPCDDSTGLMTVRTDLNVNVALIPGPINPEMEEHLQCLVDFQWCIDLAKRMLDDAGYVDTNGNGIRNLTDGSEWQIEVVTNSGGTIREGYAQIICDGWIELGIDCTAATTSFSTLMAQLLGQGGTTWSGAIVFDLASDGPAGRVNVFKCGAELYFWHPSCDPEASDGPMAQDAFSALVEEYFDQGLAASSVSDAQLGFDAMQAAWIAYEPFMNIAVQAVR